MSTNNTQYTPPSHTSHTDDDGDSFLSDLDFIRLLTIAQKQIFWLAFFFIFSVLGAFFYLRYTEKIYDSDSIIKLDNKKEVSNLGLGGVSGNPEGGLQLSNLSGEIELIKSNMIFEKLIDVLDLHLSFFAYGNVSYMERYKSAPFTIEFLSKKTIQYDTHYDVKILDKNTFLFSKSNSSEVPIKGMSNIPFHYNGSQIKVTLNANLTDKEEGMYFFVLNSTQAILADIKNNLNVSILNAEAGTIKIAYKSHNSLKAHDIVEAIDSIYQMESLAKRNRMQEQTLSFLEKQLKETEANLDLYELQIESFARRNKTVDIKSDLSKSVEKVETFDQEMHALNQQISLLDELKELISFDQEVKTHIPSLSILSDQQIVTGVVTLNKLQIERELLLTSYNEGTYVIKSKDIEILNIQKNLVELIKHNKRLVLKRVVDLGTRVNKLDNLIDGLPTKDTEFNRLKRYFNLYEKFYLMLMEKKAEYGIAKAGTVPEFTILSQPTIHTVPIFPSTASVYIGAVGFAFLASIVLLLSSYYTHNTISNQGELEKLTIATVLGVVPRYTKEKLEVSKLVVHLSPKSPLSEAMRTVRTNLEFMGGSGKQKRILSVTSTISGEGKTFIAINLGGIIAMSGVKTIIIDLDMRKPKVNQAFGDINDKGMSTILIGKHKLSECIHTSPIEGFDYLTAGPMPPNPSELILLPAFDQVISELQLTYDMIIIDTPPVGLVTDGVIIMQKVDIPIYVIRADYSKKGFENNVNNLIRKNGFKNLTLILNSFNANQGYGYGHKYGYGVGRGYGGGYYTDEDKKSKLGELYSQIKSKFKKS